MPLTDLIEEELLATLDGEGDPQAVLDRHSGSKGPLYSALARATAQGSTRFSEVRSKLRQAQARLRKVEEAAREEVTTLSERYRQLCGDAAELEKEVAFARALASHDDATWAAVAPETWVGLLRCLQVWADANLVNPEVSMPDAARKIAKGIHEYTAAYGPARAPAGVGRLAGRRRDDGSADWLRSARPHPVSGPAVGAGSAVAVLRSRGRRKKGRRSLGPQPRAYGRRNRPRAEYRTCVDAKSHGRGVGSSGGTCPSARSHGEPACPSARLRTWKRRGWPTPVS